MRLLRKCVLAFVVLVTLALCIGPMVFLAGLVLVPAIHVQRTIHDLPVYPGAGRLFTERSQYSIGGIKTVIVVYWTADHPDTVQHHYETVEALTFYAYDDVLRASMGNTTINSQGRPTCAYKKTYDCISLKLVDASQQDFYQLVGTPAGFKRQTVPDELAALPHTGTVLMFSFRLADFT